MTPLYFYVSETGTRHQLTDVQPSKLPGYVTAIRLTDQAVVLTHIMNVEVE